MRVIRFLLKRKTVMVNPVKTSNANRDTHSATERLEKMHGENSEERSSLFSF